jgi:hypothetical protein
MQKKYGNKRIPDLKSKEYKNGRYIKERIISNKQIAGAVLTSAALIGGSYALGAEFAPMTLPSKSKMTRNYRNLVEEKARFDRFKNRGSSARKRENAKNFARDIGVSVGLSLISSLGLSGVYSAQNAYYRAKNHYPTPASARNSYNFTLGKNGTTVPENRLTENRLTENILTENRLTENILPEKLESGITYTYNSRTGRWVKTKPLKNATYW